MRAGRRPIAVGNRLAVKAYEEKGGATRMLFANLCGGYVRILTAVDSGDEGSGPALRPDTTPASDGDADGGTSPRAALLIGGLAVAFASSAIVWRRRKASVSA